MKTRFDAPRLFQDTPRPTREELEWEADLREYDEFVRGLRERIHKENKAMRITPRIDYNDFYKLVPLTPEERAEKAELLREGDECMRALKERAHREMEANRRSGRRWSTSEF